MYKSRILILKSLLFLLAIIPTFLAIKFLITFFPYTGLARVGTIPATIFLNSILVFIGFRLSEKMKMKTVKALFGFLLICATVLLAIGMHPQEYQEKVYKQLWVITKAIKDYDDFTITDLNVPISREAKDSERYVVALYKFKDQLPLDGSLYIYNDKRNGSSFKDISIRSLEDIPSILQPNHRFIWRVLQKIK